MSSAFLRCLALLLICAPTFSAGHGRMLLPCSRMSGYLCGFGTPVNYDDHGMYCGGREVQWDQNGGKCGICGDPWSGPRRYERPDGVMVQHQVISETYWENQVITVRLQITVAHKGWHEFRICDVATSGGVEATQECLNRTLLADESGVTQFKKGTTEAGVYDFLLVLPPGLTCRQCVLQWKWKCGNDYGCSPSGECCTGCGDRQEEFYACADVTIKPRDLRVTNTTVLQTPSTTTTTTTSTARPTTASTPSTTSLPTTTTSTTRPTTASTSSTTSLHTTTTTTATTTPRPATPVLLTSLSSKQTQPTTKTTPTTTPTTPTTTTTPTPTTTTTRTTTATTTATTRPTTTEQTVVRVPGNSFLENFFKLIQGSRNTTNDNSMKYYGSSSSSSSSSSGLVHYNSPEEFMNMVMGVRPPAAVQGDAFIYGHNQASLESEQKRSNDRVCAVCASKNCHFAVCRAACPDVPLCDLLAP